MKIAVCDDINEQRMILKEYLRRLEKEEHLEIDVCEFSSGEDLLDYIKSGKHTPPDCLFLDIYMHGLDGIATARELRATGYDGSVVFCTTSIEHAVESYKLKADGYLVKPYNYEDFIEAIWRCRRHFEKSRKCLRFVSERLEYAIPFNDVLYIETEQRCCMVHTKKETIRTYKKIDEFEKEVEAEPSFIKIGRCYLVNMNAVAKIDNDKLTLTNNDNIILPLRDKKKLAQAINDYFWSIARGGTNG
ncbi:MAG: response regulator transcription factor [Oscillospiraceae bacterium]|nr:response regulator transcription factor [Oscillospiraceae bacterium]MBQ8624523.1 response regulator transcription factor [Oscillospiraceae bacterium]